jgi:predicted nucleotidyltransferase component of viral defense system
MIDKETLARISKLTGLKLFQQEKNYFQTIVLRSIYSKVSRELVFKGGTALAFFYGLNRFSEDLDFTLNGDLDLSRLVKEMEKDFELLNIRATFKIIEDNPKSFSFRIGVEGPLFTKEIERCFIRVEISKREKISKNLEIKELRPIYPDILPFFVTVLNLEEILAEKIRALFWRGKSRDLYDVWFLLEKGVKVDWSLVNEKLSYYGKGWDPKEFLKKIDALEKVWKRELEPIILGSVPDFKGVRKTIKAKLKSS